MKKLVSILAALIWFMPATVQCAKDDVSSAAAKIDDGLLEVVMAAPADTLFDILVSTGTETHGAQTLAAAAETLKKRHSDVAAYLRQQAAGHQASLVASLNRPSSRPQLLKRYWIADLVRVRSDREGLFELAARNDVVRISPNQTVDLIEPVAAADGPNDVHSAEANFDAIGARAVWALGYTGKGRLVASIDTGVEEIHPALRASWRGRHGDTAAAWFDPYGGAAPLDQNGHGTHVMGVMVGAGATDTIGLAPDAEWITAGVIDRGSSLATTIADIIDALEWVVDPDGDPSTTSDVPDVVCNSWGISQTIVDPCDAIFFEAIENVEAMGVVCVFAAGNEGPGSMTIRNPADHAGSATSTFSVGAADPTIAGFPVPSFSSRGPSACDGLSIKPEIVAPGVAVYSSFKGQSYRTMNGTSMAAPYVAGAVALLRQFNPELTPEQIKQVLLETASDIGDAGEDNESGRGLLNLPAAIAAIQPRIKPEVALAGVLADAAGDAIIAPGETAPLTVTLHGSVSEALDLVGTLRSLTPNVTVAVGVANYGALPAGATIDNSDAPFVISVPASVAVGDSLSFEITLSGDPLLTGWADTLSMVCGLPEGGQVGTLDNGLNSLSLSNFGQLGLGPNSQLDAGGEGWHNTLSGQNILYESALMIASESGAFADAARGSAFDFAPAAPVTTELKPDGSQLAASAFSDTRAQVPVGVTVGQNVTMYSEPESGSFAIVELRIHNRTSQTIPGMQCGLLIDIDLPDAGAGLERIVAFSDETGFYHENPGHSLVAGIVRLDGAFDASHYFINAPGKSALNQAAKSLALQPGHDFPSADWGDAFTVVATAPADIAAGQSLTLALAFILTDTPEQFAAAAAGARNRWDQYTAILDEEEEQNLLPEFSLSQNFPNPFNPETVIAYTLAHDANVRLEVFNLLGQSVRVLADGWNTAGQQTVVWNGADAGGRPVASGVYFYRLLTDRQTVTRKMVLMR